MGRMPTLWLLRGEVHIAHFGHSPNPYLRQRMSQTPGSTALGVDIDLLSVCARHSSTGDPEVVAIVARFICALFTQPSALSSDAVSRYLAKDGTELYGRYACEALIRLSRC